MSNLSRMDAEELADVVPEIKTARLRLTIAFEGLAYQGWQTQRHGTGVQEKVEQAFKKIFGIKVSLHGSSRTDTGVHALGLVAHADLPVAKLKMPPEKIRLAVNAHLPEDIRVLEARFVSKQFHARFSASGKQYRYFVWNHRSHHPLWRRTSWHVPQQLDLAAMRAGAALLVGTHDFRSFAVNTRHRMEDTVRTVTRCAILRQGPMLTIVIEGTGFLYKMCRGLAGTLVQIGQGKLEANKIIEIIAREDRRVAGMTAPALGLVLWKVFYKKKLARAVAFRPREEGG